jgi:hypothetical protein
MRNYTYTYLEPRPRLRITYSGPPGLKGPSPYILGLTTGRKDIRPASHHHIENAERERPPLTERHRHRRSRGALGRTCSGDTSQF